MIASAWLIAALAAVGDLRVTAPDVDESVVERGLEARVGDATADWIIEVQPGTLPGHVHLKLTPPDGRVVERDVELEGEDGASRARQLASILALIVEQTRAESDAAATPTPTPSSAAPVDAWAGVLVRTGINARRPVGADPGLGVAAGMWFDRVHLQPVVQFAWGRTSGRGLRLDGLRFGAGLLAGSAFGEGRWWAGAGAIAHAMWASARAERRVTDWFSVTEAMGVIQYRGSWWTLGARLGIDIVLPPLSARGDAARTRWDAARPAASVTLAVRLPPRIRAAMAR